MSNRVRLRVADAHQRDVGHGKVRISRDAIEKLAVTVGDFVEVQGKRRTVVIVWPALPEYEGRDIVQMDGLLRKNAGVEIDEQVVLKKAVVKDSHTIVFAPTDVRLNVDEEFRGFVKRRFINMPFVEDDMTLLSIFGSAVPLVATKTRPKGPVKIADSTVVRVMSEPTPAMVSMEHCRFCARSFAAERVVIYRCKHCGKEWDAERSYPEAYSRGNIDQMERRIAGEYEEQHHRD